MKIIERHPDGSPAVIEWAGIPMPLEGQPLVVEPRYKFAAAFTREPEEIEPGVTLRNCFYSRRLHTNVLIWDEPARPMAREGR